MSNANIDPITLTVVWNGLLSIAEEMGSTLRRTAFSEAVREGDDFSTGLFDAMGASSHWSNPNIGGVDPKTGRQFVMYDLGFAGYGARVDSDGPEALAPVVNCRNIPVEVHETNNPVRIRRLELIEDSGGAGRHRGGCGLRKDIELRAPSATATLLGDRHTNPPYGVFGGQPGATGATLLVREGTTESLGSKDVLDLREGDLLSFRLAGAGGYGDPRDRDREAVRRDVADGLVSPQAARTIYGLDPDARD